MFNYKVIVKNGHCILNRYTQESQSNRLSVAVEALTQAVRNATFDCYVDPGTPIKTGTLFINGKKTMTLSMDPEELYRMNASADQTEAEF